MSARRFAELIGDPVGHARSPEIHNFWLEKLGIDAEYHKTRVASEALRDFFHRRRDEEGWLGCNVTIPHKQTVPPLLDRLDPDAARIGAVNTVVREDGALVGYNTDAPGFIEPLRPLLAGNHLFRMARILGAGGAACAVAHALWNEGFTLVILARDPGRAEALRSSFDPAHSYAAALGDLAQPTDFAFDDRRGILDIVVNATPLGMMGKPGLALDFSHVPPGAIIYDIVYAPLETPLLAEARARGHPTVDGLRMLVAQAAIAFEKLFGAAAPGEHDDELRERLAG